MATIGDTGAPSTNTLYYDALLSTTLDAYVGSGKMFDQVFKDSAFLAALRMKDAVQKQDGGERIRAPLMYDDNSTIKSYSGYDTLDTTPQDGMTTAFYEWREIGGTISISRIEERKNSGEAQIMSLLQNKIRQAEMTMREQINKQLILGTVSGTTFVPGNSAKDMNPLAYFIRKDNTADPAAGGTVGNIAASNTWWRPITAVADNASIDTGNSFALNVSTYKGYVVALKRLYNYCSRGSGGSPNLILGDQTSFETYESALDQNTRYTDTKMADMGFDTIKLRGATFIWDEQVPGLDTGALPGASGFTGTVFMLNTNFYQLMIDSQTDIVTTPFVEPENQTAKTAKILFMANSLISNARKNGVLYAISQTIVS